MKTPYLDSLMETIKTQEELLFRYNLRISGLMYEIEHNNKLSEHQINENHITILKTQAEIETLEKVIKEKRDYFTKYAKHFEKEYAEMETDYKKVIKRASELSLKNKILQGYFKNVNLDSLEDDKEAKLLFYKTVKEQL